MVGVVEVNHRGQVSLVFHETVNVSASHQGTMDQEGERDGPWMEIESINNLPKPSSRPRRMLHRISRQAAEGDGWDRIDVSARPATS